MVDGAGNHGNGRSVDELKNRAVVFLVESDVEDSIGIVGQVEARHSHHKHKPAVGVHFQGQGTGIDLIFGLRVGVDDLSFDGFDAHAGEQRQKDGDCEDGGDAACGCGVLAVSVVAEKRGGGEKVDVAESFGNGGADGHYDQFG